MSQCVRKGVCQWVRHGVSEFVGASERVTLWVCRSIDDFTLWLLRCVQLRSSCPRLCFSFYECCWGVSRIYQWSAGVCPGCCLHWRQQVVYLCLVTLLFGFIFYSRVYVSTLSVRLCIWCVWCLCGFCLDLTLTLFWSGLSDSMSIALMQ